MRLFGKADAKALVSREPEEIEVKSWGGRVRLRHITGLERLSYLDGRRRHDYKSVQAAGMADMADLIILCAIDEKGEQLWTEEDFETVVSLPPKGFEQVATHAAKMNGLIIEADEEK